MTDALKPVHIAGNKEYYLGGCEAEVDEEYPESDGFCFRMYFFLQGRFQRKALVTGYLQGWKNDDDESDYTQSPDQVGKTSPEHYRFRYNVKIRYYCRSGCCKTGTGYKKCIYEGLYDPADYIG